MSKFNMQDAIVQSITDTLNEHNIKPSYDRSRGQVAQIVELCNEYTSRFGRELIFDNEYANHYKLILDGKEYEFLIYKDVINALNMLLI